MNDHRLSKIEVLIQQNRYAEAEQVLKELLHADATNVHFLALLSEVFLQQDKIEEAKKAIDNAIGMAPDYPHLFYIRSRIAIQEGKLDEAETIIHSAITLDPRDADFYALLANIQLGRKKFDAALQQTDLALEIDPENLLALNTRSTALIKLGRKEESFKAIEGALREDPDNAYTHANYGWGLLEKGEHKKALEHFREALKNNPNLPIAQSGMVEALKASNLFYRLFLKYAFWMSNLTSKYQWGVIIGFYIFVRVLATLGNYYPDLKPYVTPLIILLTLFAFSTWIITPVSNLFLRFNRYGNFLLDRNEKMNSNLVAISFLFCLAGAAAFFITRQETFITVAVFGFAMMVPLASMFTDGPRKKVNMIYATVMGIAGAAGIITAFISGDLFNGFSILFLVGFVGYQWISNFLAIRADNK